MEVSCLIVASITANCLFINLGNCEGSILKQIKMKRKKYIIIILEHSEWCIFSPTNQNLSK